MSVRKLMRGLSVANRQRRHAPKLRMCFLGPLGRVGRPPGVRVVLVVARDLARPARARPGRSASVMSVGRREQRLDRRSARARPPIPPAARASSASAASSPASTAPPAPSAHTPAQLATHSARRPASQRPSWSRTTHSTRQRAARVADQPQRPAHLLELEAQPVVGRRRSSCSRAADAVVSGRAAAASSAITRSASAVFSAAGA